MDNTKGMKKANISSDDLEESTSALNKINIRSLLVTLGIAIIISFVLVLYNKKRENDRLNHYDYIIVGSGLYGAKKEVKKL